MRLLWVDDDGPGRFRYEIRRLRKEFSVEVYFALTIAGAKKKIENNIYDFVILDQQLPPDDARERGNLRGGLEILKMIRSQDPTQARTLPSVPVLIVSAFFDKEIHDETVRIDEKIIFEGKPLDFERVATVLRESHLTRGSSGHAEPAR